MCLSNVNMDGYRSAIIFQIGFPPAGQEPIRYEIVIAALAFPLIKRLNRHFCYEIRGTDG